ncbi:hypothetical protein MMC29_000148 [Sticta canariensis]|nr:hypothetical protein [Sticta canariensis]
MLLQPTSPRPRSPGFSTLNENSSAVGPRYGSAETKSVRSKTLSHSDPFDLFPAFLRGKLCWDPSSFYDAEHKYIMQLDQTDILAIETAIASFNALGKDLPSLSPETFPLPAELRHRLRHISHQVHHGIGFAVLRGLDPRRYNDTENVIAYCGLASYVGVERVTNAFGMSMNHLRNAEQDARPKDREDRELNASKRSKGMKFHADRYYADILAMYFKQNAALGGEQYLASFWTIYNMLMVEAPNVLKVLAQDWEWPPSSITTLDGPVLYQSAGRVLVQLVWQPFIEHPSFLSEEQKQALDKVQEIAKRVSIELDHKEGDIQFVNNFALLHARKGFKDSTENSRHILRMGIRDLEHGWTLPKQYNELTNLAFKPVEDQTIPVHDFDPYFKTTVAATTHHHG